MNGCVNIRTSTTNNNTFKNYASLFTNPSYSSCSSSNVNPMLSYAILDYGVLILASQLHPIILLYNIIQQTRGQLIQHHNFESSTLSTFMLAIIFSAARKQLFII